MNIAIIPARGGSKRIPRKNITNFSGKPIIAWSIEAAQDSRLFDHVIVSTDDEEIAAIARKYNAEVPFIRPPELADDYTSTFDVVRHCILWCEDNNIYSDRYCCIYATAPFVKPETLKHGLSVLEESEKSFAFSVTPFEFPIQRALRLSDDGSIQAIWPENNIKRSQDLEDTYHDAGQFYWGLKEAFLEDIPLYSVESAPVILPKSQVQDIDTPDDWKRAEALFSIARK